jgi:hypothetical protein
LPDSNRTGGTHRTNSRNCLSQNGAGSRDASESRQGLFPQPPGCGFVFAKESSKRAAAIDQTTRLPQPPSCGFVGARHWASGYIEIGSSFRSLETAVSLKQEVCHDRHDCCADFRSHETAVASKSTEGDALWQALTYFRGHETVVSLKPTLRFHQEPGFRCFRRYRPAVSLKVQRSARHASAEHTVSAVAAPRFRRSDNDKDFVQHEAAAFRGPKTAVSSKIRHETLAMALRCGFRGRKTAVSSKRDVQPR